YHLLLKHYYIRITGVMERAMDFLESSLGPKYETTLIEFVEEFPPLSVYQGKNTAREYLTTNLANFGDLGRGVRAAVIEEMLLVKTKNNNPALRAYSDLFDDSVLNSSEYDE